MAYLAAGLPSCSCPVRPWPLLRERSAELASAGGGLGLGSGGRQRPEVPRCSRCTPGARFLRDAGRRLGPHSRCSNQRRDCVTRVTRSLTQRTRRPAAPRPPRETGRVRAPPWRAWGSAAQPERTPPARNAAEKR